MTSGRKYIDFYCVILWQGYPQRRWNIVFIAASNLTDMDQSLEVMKGTGFSISVVTFDESKTWLLWNSLMQTRQVLYLPSCTEQIGCGVGTRSILTEHLLEILGDQRSRRFFRKVRFQKLFLTIVLERSLKLMYVTAA